MRSPRSRRGRLPGRPGKEAEEHTASLTPPTSASNSSCELCNPVIRGCCSCFRSQTWHRLCGEPALRLGLLGPPCRGCVHMSRCIITGLPAGGGKTVPGGWGGGRGCRPSSGEGAMCCAFRLRRAAERRRKGGGSPLLPALPPPSLPPLGMLRPGCSLFCDSSVMKWA